MNDLEVNKIIAEFMRDTFLIKYFELLEEVNKGTKKGLTMELIRLASHTNGRNPMLYTESLDSLVPVWDKLNMYRVTLERFGKDYSGYSADLELSHNYETEGKTIQQAVAHATAKAVLGLDND